MKNTHYSIGIYVRESRDDNGNNYETIEVQRDLLINFIERNAFGTVYKVYVDDNVSGSAFERKGLDNLKADIISNNINMLVMKDLSRLGRNNAKTLMFLDFLEEYGVRVITYDGRYDSLRDNDTVGIDTWYNERYIRDISKKIRASLRFKIERGEYLGNAPYGYMKSIEHKNKLCIDQNKARVVKEIYELYRSGYGYAYVAKLLNSRAYQSPSASGIWNAITVKRILCNVVYTGCTVQGVSEKISFKSKKTRRLPPEKWVITENTHEAIINIDEYNEVQRIREGKNTVSGTHKGEIHLFKDILFCGKCGNTMFSRSRKNRPLSYICSTYAKKGSSACSSHCINEKFLKKVISAELTERLQETNTRKALVALLQKENPKMVENSDDEKHLEQLLVSKQRQQDTLYLDKLEGKISEQLFLRMNMNIDNRILKIQNDIKNIKKIQKECFDWNKSIELFYSSLKEAVLTNEMMKILIKKIIVIDNSAKSDNCKNISDGKKEKNKIKEVVIEFQFSESKNIFNEN